MMSKEYQTPEWKQWSSVYCHRCSKWLANFKGWFKFPIIEIELYCRKCTEEIMKEQQTLTQESQS